MALGLTPPNCSASGVSRVLHLADHPSRGGAARAAFRIHRALSGSVELDSTFARFLGASAEPEPDADCENLPSSPRVFRSDFLNTASAYFRHLLSAKSRLLYDFLLGRNTSLEDWIASNKTDIVLIHWVRPRDVPARSLRRINVPVVAVLHDARFILGISHYPENSKDPRGPVSLTWQERIASALVRAALPLGRTTLICPSAWMRQVAIQAGWREEAIRYVPYPIGINFWDRATGIVDDEKKNHFQIGFGFSGEHAASRKGADVLSDAIQILAAGRVCSAKQVDFLFFGDAVAPNLPSHSTSLIAAQSLGHLDDSQLRLLLTQLDLVVVPSRQENLAQIALEAQACGTAVIVSNNTGLESALVPGGGWTFVNGSPSDLAAVIEEALKDHAEVEVRGQTARQGARRLFSEEAIVGQYVSHFHALGNYASFTNDCEPN